MSESTLALKRKCFKSNSSLKTFGLLRLQVVLAYHGEPPGCHVNSISELGHHTQRVSKITLVRAEIEVTHKGPVRYPQESTDSPLLDIALKMLSFCRSPWSTPEKKNSWQEMDMQGTNGYPLALPKWSFVIGDNKRNASLAISFWFVPPK